MDRPIIKKSRKPRAKKSVVVRKKRSPLKFKKSVVDKKKAKTLLDSKDKSLGYDVCMSMPIREIRKSKEYKNLTPLGKLNKSGHYRFGNKSSMNKGELCKALNDPKKYQQKIKSLKEQKKNAAKRSRSTRKGMCPTSRNFPVCSEHSSHKFAGLTTTGQHCCFKKKQSKKVMNKRQSA